MNESTKSLRLKVELPSYLNDLPEVLRAFSPLVSITTNPSNPEFLIKLESHIDKQIYTISFDNKEIIKEFDIKLSNNENSLLEHSYIKTECKRILYVFCREIFKISLPYGCLTGVRPTKLYYSHISIYSNIKEHFINRYYVEPKRAKLIEEVVFNQKGIYLPSDKNVDLFLNIPICQTKCKYCSFSTADYNSVHKDIPEYIDCMIAELKIKIDYIKNNNLILRSIYVGGGTPTCLENVYLEKLLSILDFGVEFTVEAGRPDSITKEKLVLLKKLGVTRVSINPQSFKEETLKLIGRNHNNKMLLDAYNIARSIGFDINMDLIIGLPEETFEDFSKTLSQTLSLIPENITVHSLSLKNGSFYKNFGLEKNISGNIKIMADYAYDTLLENGYFPYYMYRQKNMADNLENIGYSLDKKQCVYNIDYMEETNTIIGIGAGAMSKFVFIEENRIERVCNKKDIKLYINDCQKYKNL